MGAGSHRGQTNADIARIELRQTAPETKPLHTREVGRLCTTQDAVHIPAVQLPTKYVMIVKLKTAKALGFTVPQSVLLAANEVIE
jgi:hypothetical protein